MYLVDFAKRLSKSGNITIIIYLLLNVFVIGFVVHTLLGPFIAMNYVEPSYYNWFDLPMPSFWISLCLGLIVYFVSISIALSPVGEYILRIQTGCHVIKQKDQADYLSPIFKEVYERAKAAEPSLPDDIQLFISSEKVPNAFATGRKTLCITEGMLHVSSNELKGVLGHEFAHLANKDTDLILLVTVGNFIVTTIILIIRCIVGIISFFLKIGAIISGGEDGVIGAMLVGLGHTLFVVCVSGLMWLWTKTGQILVLYSRRNQEFAADEFSFKLGYGNGLCEFLDRFDGARAKGVFAVLSSSHPRRDDRIGRMQTLGATYRRARENR